MRQSVAILIAVILLNIAVLLMESLGFVWALPVLMILAVHLHGAFGGFTGGRAA